mmetsp:Transcript_42627/g.108316  ORF Transcript_42627/g.108316 Transcript_42627/m.108316 type:complete len:248 (+) Transcript_42627:194-937(+)
MMTYNCIINVRSESFQSSLSEEAAARASKRSKEAEASLLRRSSGSRLISSSSWLLLWPPWASGLRRPPVDGGDEDEDEARAATSHLPTSGSASSRRSSRDAPGDRMVDAIIAAVTTGGEAAPTADAPKRRPQGSLPLRGVSLLSGSAAGSGEAGTNSTPLNRTLRWLPLLLRRAEPARTRQGVKEVPLPRSAEVPGESRGDREDCRPRLASKAALSAFSATSRDLRSAARADRRRRNSASGASGMAP